MAQIDVCNILPLQMDLLVYRQLFLLKIKLILNYSTVEWKWDRHHQEVTLDYRHNSPDCCS